MIPEKLNRILMVASLLCEIPTSGAPNSKPAPTHGRP
jgi:hypothetical protein